MQEVVLVKLCLMVQKCCLCQSSLVLLEMHQTTSNLVRGKVSLSSEKVFESESSSKMLAEGCVCVGCGESLLVKGCSMKITLSQGVSSGRREVLEEGGIRSAQPWSGT